jgi:hypothetical protein
MKDRREHSAEYYRELRKIERRTRKQRFWMLFSGMMLVLFVIAFTLGGTLIYEKNVEAFVNTIDQKSPAEVKAQLQRFAAGLTNRNPIIRQAAVVAFKTATGWRLGNDAAVWSAYWSEHQAQWEYHKSDGKPRPATAPDWTALLPSTNAVPPPTPQQ